MKNLAAFFVGLFIAAALLLPTAAKAAITMTPSVEGLAGGTYKPIAMPSLVGPNFSATGSVFVNGKAVPIPGYIPPASTAAQAAKSSLFANPWLLGVSLLGWAGDAGLHSDEVGGWAYTDPNGGTGPNVPVVMPVDANVKGCRSCPNTGCYCDASMQECAVNFAPLGVSERYCVAMGKTDNQVKGAYAGADEPGNPSGWIPPQYQPYGTCPSGYANTPGTSSCAPQAETRPATADDFNALPDPSPEVQRELAPQVGVPVDDPVFEPADVPIGDPYTRPDGSTAEPRARISPASNGQVTVDTYDQPLTSPTGEPIANPTPEDTTEQTEQPTQCDKYPNTLGCTPLGSPVDGDALPHASVALSFSPLAIPSNAVCPAPMTISAFGQSIPVAYDSACTYASGLKPIVVAVAYLTAAFIIFGVPRSSNNG
ncbi:virulence factor TspB C-terminal domain-related protein [Thiobacillus denitrificans]|uniref:virulence factor TspB C-terminal domain-related protein n=1 Tax=Thiobacillus denitrificans TaxID=36861 RepID=UPI0012FB7F22|nr:virulence factor TspB C-terminal domain-related protein [Thiobacillus denitrificans]